MKTIRQILLLTIFTLGTFALLAGCVAMDEDESTIPWSRPADWEGQMPGMGGR